jgi:hypothetical protein
MDGRSCIQQRARHEGTAAAFRGVTAKMLPVVYWSMHQLLGPTILDVTAALRSLN